MQKLNCFVGQKVKTTIRFAYPADVPAGTPGDVLECRAEEAVLAFPDKRVTAFYSAFEPV